MPRAVPGVHAVFTALGFLLALVVGLALVSLLVPIHLRAHGVFTDARVDAVATASWGFGLLTVRAAPDEALAVRLFGLRVYRYRSSHSERKPRENKKSASRRKLRPRLVARVVRVMRRSMDSLRLRATIAGRLGAGDPADTAVIYGALATTRSLVPRLDTRGLVVDWVEPALDLDGHVEGWLWPVAIAWIAIGEFAFEPR